MRKLHLVILGAVIILDRLTKWVAADGIPLKSAITIIPGLFQLTHLENSGIAFGLLADSGWYTGTAISIMSSLGFAAVLLVLHLVSKSTSSSSISKIKGLTLIAAGAAGNLWDRVANSGRVINFLDFYFLGHHWPTFNLADSSIVVGTLLLIAAMMREGRPTVTEKRKEEPRPPKQLDRTAAETKTEPEPSGFPATIEKAEETLRWILLNIVEGSSLRRFVILAVGSAALGNPAVIGKFIPNQLPGWYTYVYLSISGLFGAAAVIAGLRASGESAVPSSQHSSAVRGLLPFNLEDSVLFSQLEREGELERVLLCLSDPSIRFSILVGASGTGKTSFLRAGLLAELRERNIPAVYVELSDEDPIASIQRELVRQDPSKTSRVILLDQFEQFFLHQRSAEQRAPLLTLLERWYRRDSGVRALISIRDEDFAQMMEIQARLDYQLSNQNCFKLAKFSPAQAASVLETLCEYGKIPFDPDFVFRTVSHELCDVEDGLISPVNIGIVVLVVASGGKTFTASDLQSYGGIDGLLEVWLHSQLEASKYQGIEKAAVRTLTSLCDFDRNRRAGILSVEVIVDKLAGDLNRDEVNRALQWLTSQQVRLAVRIERPEFEGYQLSHERLIPAMRKVAGRLLSEAARANELLDRRVREWVSNDRDSRFLLRLHEYWRISRQRPYLIWGTERIDKELLLKRTRKRWQQQLLLTACGVLFGIGAYFLWCWTPVQRRYIRWELSRMAEADPSESAIRALTVIDDWQKAGAVANRLPNSGNLLREMARSAVKDDNQKYLQQILKVVKNANFSERCGALAEIASDLEMSRDFVHAKELLDEIERELQKGPSEACLTVIGSYSTNMMDAGLTQGDQNFMEATLRLTEKLGPTIRLGALQWASAGVVKAGATRQNKDLVNRGRELLRLLDSSTLASALSSILQDSAAIKLFLQDSAFAEEIKGQIEHLDLPSRCNVLAQITDRMMEVGDYAKAKEFLGQLLHASAELDIDSRLNWKRRLLADSFRIGLATNDSKMTSQVLQSARTLDRNRRNSALLDILGVLITDNKNQTVFIQSFEIAAQMDDPRLRIDGLRRIAQAIVNAGSDQINQKLLDKLLFETQKLATEDRSQILVTVAPYMAGIGLTNQDRKTLDKSLQMAANLDVSSRSAALAPIVVQMASAGVNRRDRKLLDEALGLAEKLNPYQRSQALESIIMHMLPATPMQGTNSFMVAAGQPINDPHVFDEILRVAGKLDPYARSGVMKTIIQVMAWSATGSNDGALLTASLRATEKLSPSDRSVVVLIIQQMTTVGISNNHPEMVEQALKEADRLSSPDRTAALKTIATSMIGFGTSRKDQSFFEKALNVINKTELRERPALLRSVALAMDGVGQRKKARALLKEAVEDLRRDLPTSPGLNPALVLIAGDMAKLGDLKQARDIAESIGGSARVTDALANIVFADSGVQPPVTVTYTPQ